MADSIIVIDPSDRVLDANGNPVSGARLKFYDAGTSTPKTVYSDAALSVSLGNTVYCDSGGYPVTSSGGSTKCTVYTGTAAYKLVITDSSDVTIAEHDNLRGASDLSIYSTATATNNEPTLAKSGNYTVVSGDGYKTIVCTQSGGAFTLTLPSAVTVGDGWWVRVYLKSTSSSNAVTLATVSSQTIASHTTAGTSLVLTGGGSGGKIKSDGAGWIWEPDQTAGAGVHTHTSIASASTTNLGATTADVVEITGTTTITSFGTTPNIVRFIRFAGALTLTHNATTLILPGATNITTVAGDTAIVASDSSGNWRMWVAPVQAATQAQMEAASSTIAPVTPGRQHFHPGHPKAWGFVTVSGGTPTMTTSYNMDSAITDNGAGDFTLSIATDLSSANYAVVGTVLDANARHLTVDPTTAMAAGAFRVNIYSAVPGKQDPSGFFFAVFGDI